MDAQPTPSSSPTPTPTPPASSLLSSSLSPPLIVGFISVGAFAVAIVAICAWSRFLGRSVVPHWLLRYRRFLPAALRRGRRWEGEGEGEEEEGGGGQRGRRRARGRGGVSVELVKAKPEMFDAWIEGGRRTGRVDVDVDILKWEAESVVSEIPIFHWFSFLLMRV